MSEKTKKRVRLNVIDVLVIILVIALIATVVYRLYTGIDNKISPASSKYVITFEADDQYNSLTEYLSNGKAVYFASNGQLLGKMYTPSGKSAPACIVEDDAASDQRQNDFTYEKVCIEGYMKMSSEAIKSTSGEHYSIGEINVTVGSRIDVYTNETVFTLTVKSIDSK